MSRPLALVSGTFSGIGLDLAATCAKEGFDLLVIDDGPEMNAAAERFRRLGAQTTLVDWSRDDADGADRLFWTKTPPASSTASRRT